MPLSRQEDVAAARRQNVNAALLQPQPQQQQQQQEEEEHQKDDSNVQADNSKRSELHASTNHGEQGGPGGIAAARAVSKAGQVQQPRATNTIVIHVKDDARKMSKDFPCDRDILLK